ncbi:hypothetical protein P4S68_11010, partial [Pseudoalteromonas sp. Hal099]
GILRSASDWVFNRFAFYRETLSRFSCAASAIDSDSAGVIWVATRFGEVWYLKARAMVKVC